MTALIFRQDSLQNFYQLTLASASKSKNTVYGSHKTIYQDLLVLRQMTQSEFPIYLVRSRISNQSYAMKVFPRTNKQSYIKYHNSIRFAGLQHPNVLRSLYFEKHRNAEFTTANTQISYVIMEHAPNGNLSSLLQYSQKLDDILIRTYFRQLISGLEFLHNTGIAHMDLKLENLLLDTNYTLKIGGFDTAHYSDDAIILSNGSGPYRAPEMIEGDCKIPAAADIYSAGIILLILMNKKDYLNIKDETRADINADDLLESSILHMCGENSKISDEHDLSDLLIKMTKLDLKSRATIAEIKASKWYNGSVYSPQELKEKVSSLEFSLEISKNSSFFSESGSF